MRSTAYHRAVTNPTNIWQSTIVSLTVQVWHVHTCSQQVLYCEAHTHGMHGLAGSAQCTSSCMTSSLMTHHLFAGCMIDSIIEVLCSLHMQCMLHVHCCAAPCRQRHHSQQHSHRVLPVASHRVQLPTIGCGNLSVLQDHMPLLSISGSCKVQHTHNGACDVIYNACCPEGAVRWYNRV